MLTLMLKIKITMRMKMKTMVMMSMVTMMMKVWNIEVYNSNSSMGRKTKAVSKRKGSRIKQDKRGEEAISSRNSNLVIYHTTKLTNELQEDANKEAINSILEF